MPKNISTYLDNFINYLKKEKRRSAKTIENYNFYITRFITFCGDKTPTKINQTAVAQYKLWLKKLIDIHGLPLRLNTQNYHLIALRTFLKFLRQKNINTLNPKKIHLAQTQNQKNPVLESRELNLLLEAPLGLSRSDQNQIARLIAVRDKALLEVLFSTGLLVSQVSNLKIKDVESQKKLIIIGQKNKSRTFLQSIKPPQKGFADTHSSPQQAMGYSGKVRDKKGELLLSDNASYWLKKYLAQRKDKNYFLFIPYDKRTAPTGIKTKNNQPLSPRSIQRAVRKYAKLAGLTKPVTPHTLRYCHALGVQDTNKMR